MVEKEKKVLVSKKAKAGSNPVKAEKTSKKEDGLPLPSLSFLISTPKLECTFGEEKMPLVAPATQTPPILEPFWLQDIAGDKKAKGQGVRLLFNL